MPKTETQLLMIICLISLWILSIYISNQKNKARIHKYFQALSLLLQFHVLCMFLQLTISQFYNVQPVYFEYLTGIAAINLPIVFLMTAFVFFKKDFNTKKISWLFIIPIISLLVLWTNDLHHLYFIKYETNIADVVYGPYFTINCLYSYLAYAVSMYLFIKGSIKTAGFFSKQTFLIVLGCLIPISVNILGTLKLVPMDVYITPILFVATAICFALSIIKYKALNIIPIASRTVMDTMSDAFVVISNDGTIVDSNRTFKTMFNDILYSFNIQTDENFFNVIEKSGIFSLEELKKNIEITRKDKHLIITELHVCNKNSNKFFELDIHPISSKLNKEDYVATLLLFKDITQHKIDINQIKEKQEIIVKQQQLVTIGELAGGVAHDINTPISAIKTGIVMLTQMCGQRTDKECEILQRMDNCSTKIINIVNSMRNQIRNLGSDTNVKFKISDVINDIRIITYHEFAKNKSKIIVEIKDDLYIKGDPTKLGQVLTNLVVNASQAYKVEDGEVRVSLSRTHENMAMIEITDYAGGLAPSIVPYIFKNILTTKGTSGTGLGLYLAYSVIKGNFNGDITFETKEKVGTTFYITIPIA